MKFRNISRLAYLKKARHRGGHGIHSPFLFHFIAFVIGNKKKIPEYKLFKKLRKQTQKMLKQLHFPFIPEMFTEFGVSTAKPRRLIRKVELPMRYTKVLFRIVREFKPSRLTIYGPTLGLNASSMAIASHDTEILLVTSDSVSGKFANELFKDLSFSNISFASDSIPEIATSDFVLINYPFDAGISVDLVHKHKDFDGANNILVVRGIHNSVEMEHLWEELISSEKVRVSLDLFEIGIALFRKGLQKENFVLRF